MTEKISFLEEYITGTLSADLPKYKPGKLSKKEDIDRSLIEGCSKIE